MTKCFDWLAEESEQLFLRSIVIIFLLFNNSLWQDTILNAKFFENYITAKASDTAIKKLG